MKIPYKNIFDVLRTNRFIVLASVGCSALVCVVAILMIVKVHRESQNHAFVVSDQGDVVPLVLVDQRENLEVEALSHLERFHQYFYNLNANNYKKQIAKTLWLGNNSVANLFRQKQAEGIYNRLLQYSLVQKIIKIESHIDIQREPYQFKTVTTFQNNRGTITDTAYSAESGSSSNLGITRFEIG